MSRPNMSVPKMKSDAGLRKRNRTFIAEGSSEVKSGAKTAASARPTMVSKPISVMAHPGIGERVEHIDDQVDQYKGEAEDQHGSLHQRVVAGQDRLHNHPADARQRKLLFDDNRAADRRAQ